MNWGIILMIWLIASVPCALFIGACIRFGMGADEQDEELPRT